MFTLDLREVVYQNKKPVIVEIKNAKWMCMRILAKIELISRFTVAASLILYRALSLIIIRRDATYFKFWRLCNMQFLFCGSFIKVAIKVTKRSIDFDIFSAFDLGSLPSLAYFSSSIIVEENIWLMINCFVMSSKIHFSSGITLKIA